MFNKKLKEELAEQKELTDFWFRKFNEHSHLLDVATEKANFYQTKVEQISDDGLYFRMNKTDYNELIKGLVDSQNLNQKLKKQIKKMQENAGKIDINLNAQTFDVNKLARKISIEINKGRY